MEKLMGPIIYGSIIVTILMIVSIWTIYVKSGKPGWASLIPVYNVIVLLEIIGKPWWWLLLIFIPGVNLVIAVVIYHRLSLSFGKDAGFTIGLILLSLVFSRYWHLVKLNTWGQVDQNQVIS